MSVDRLQIGIGALVKNIVYTYDFTSDLCLRPYMAKIKGKDYKYGLNREFISKKYIRKEKRLFYDTNIPMVMIQFGPLEPFVVYEYRRFAGTTYGEIVEGYFVILSDCIKELEYEEVIYWCGTAREKEKNLHKGRMIFGEQLDFVKDDIDF